MINQKLSAEKFITELNSLNINGDTTSNITLLDALLLITINAHPECSKTDYVEIIYSDRSVTKSALDRPMKRLIDMDLISATEIDGANTRSGAGRVHYKLSAAGERLMKRCTT